jgi:hypothetical protein
LKRFRRLSFDLFDVVVFVLLLLLLLLLNVEYNLCSGWLLRRTDDTSLVGENVVILVVVDVIVDINCHDDDDDDDEVTALGLS